MIVIPANQWIACQPAVFSEPSSRSATAYIQCIEQFHVDVEKRYKRNVKGFTMCNIFSSDVGLAMKVPLPHWVDSTTQAPLPLAPNGLPLQRDNRMELNGNGTCKWLQTVGVKSYDWKVVTPSEAGVEASKGHMTVVTWINPGGIGHIGVIRPSVFPNLRMAQAGASNFVDGTVAQGFGSDPKRTAQLVYLSHA